MDSGDEGGDAEDSAEEKDEEEEEDKGPPLPESAAEVKSFSEMLRMAPQLMKGVRGMAASELAAICVAAGRVHFYDAALLDLVASQLRQRLAKSAACLSLEELVAVISGLKEINSYNRELFSAVCRALAAGGATTRLDAQQLKVLVDAFKAVKHAGDAAFLESLKNREKEARYQATKDRIVKDELDRRWIR